MLTTDEFITFFFSEVKWKPKFQSWAESHGLTNPDWYLDPVDDKVVTLDFSVEHFFSWQFFLAWVNQIAPCRNPVSEIVSCLHSMGKMHA